MSPPDAPPPHREGGASERVTEQADRQEDTPAGYPHVVSDADRLPGASVADAWRTWARDHEWTSYVGPAAAAWSPDGDPVHWVEAVAA